MLLNDIYLSDIYPFVVSGVDVFRTKYLLIVLLVPKKSFLVFFEAICILFLYDCLKFVVWIIAMFNVRVLKIPHSFLKCANVQLSGEI